MKKERLNIIFEDKTLLVVFKKSGVLTVNDGKHFDKTLYHQVLEYLQKKNQKVFVVHRLDRETSGIVVFAKSEKAKKFLQDNWSDTKRFYKALVHGNVKNEKGRIEMYLKEDKFYNVYETKKSDGFKAITLYKVLNYKQDKTLLDIEILTGKKHQIRVGLKSIGHPIVGDKKYGIKDNYRSMCLNAYRIVFIHPATKKYLDLSYEVNFI